MTGKIEGGCFYGVVIINAGGEVLACYEKKKDIRSVVIKIHTLRIAGEL